jgi:hypothetical protein
LRLSSRGGSVSAGPRCGAPSPPADGRGRPGQRRSRAGVKYGPHQTLTYLAALYRATGDHVRAELLYRQALEVWRKALGEDHPTYAASLSNLSGLYLATGHEAPASKVFSEVLEKQTGRQRRHGG